MRHTKQKTKLYSLLFSRKRHISADEILALMNKDEKCISTATVYRHLDELVKCGRLKKIKLGSNCIYDSSGEEHPHFVCLECGTIYDLKFEDLPVIAKAQEHEVASYEIILKGTCKECIKRRKQKWN